MKCCEYYSYVSKPVFWLSPINMATGKRTLADVSASSILNDMTLGGNFISRLDKITQRGAEDGQPLPGLMVLEVFRRIACGLSET